MATLKSLPDPLPPARAELARLHRAPEPDVLRPLLEQARLSPDEKARVEARASRLIADLRRAQGSGWVNQFLQEYRLNTEEGVALLSLAEAFLRVPDPETADALIADKLGEADWRAHAGKSNSGLVNSATWGLVMGRALVGQPEKQGVLRRLVSRAGEPFVRTAVGAAMKLMGEIFVMGRTIGEATARMRKPEHRGFTASFDMLGEAARTFPDADRYLAAYEDAIDAVGRDPGAGNSISVKLSALHPRYEVPNWDRCVPALIERLEGLAARAARARIPLTVDAEESERLDMSLAIIEAVASLPSLRSWDGLGMAVQAYSKRGRAVVAWADALGAREGRRLHVRLVKGAYWDSEIKRTQEAGLADYPLFTRKAATDVSYLACARDMLAARNIYPAFATHNALTVANILEWADGARDFEFQRLHGMGEGLYESLVRDEGYHCRIYAPVGGHRDLLAYLVRRLLENGANSSFVHQLADESLTEADLLADPVERIARVGGTRHPSIPLPQDLFQPERPNSGGLDLNDVAVLDDVARAVSASFPSAGAIGDTPGEVHWDKRAQAVADAPSGDDRARAQAAVSRAHAAFPAWSRTPIEARAAALERLADGLEEHRLELMAIAVQEARKTIPDALAEVREAVDFCRYYAAQARTKLQPIELPGPTGERNVLRLEGRGVFLTIAPWNFPLAIFLGQVAAALAAGNAVVAKPAPQTPRIAQRAIELAHAAGVPRDALVLVTGGPEAGAALVADPRVDGVAFTGSTATARRIAQDLLGDENRPLVPLIAETGGVNAMIVDSTALPEQVVLDVVTSAFRSAGQRCSALRLLCLQEETAERTLEMLRGAMDTLTVGDPARPETDVGPVIDEPAYRRLMDYREGVRDRWLHTIGVPGERVSTSLDTSGEERSPKPDRSEQSLKPDRYEQSPNSVRFERSREASGPGLFVPPTLIRLDRIEDLRREWFGPLLHVATWPAGDLERTVERINASGYGLTMGLHSRIQRAAEAVEAEAQVGNLYINRSMIGAIVGSQPFGGERLSGTGPKAGGPNYLPRFCAERTTSTDTTSAGGNATLLSIGDLGL